LITTASTPGLPLPTEAPPLEQPGDCRYGRI
jgi:hypothetical protein